MSYLHDTKCEFHISTARHVRIFWGFRKGGLSLVVVYPLNISTQNFMVLHRLASFASPQKFGLPPFWNG
jgi:hypothetical protein